jgi:hypothetical protein
MLVEDLKPLWAEATTARPGISLNIHRAFPTDELDTLLHRQVVEIRDAMIDTRVQFRLSERDRALVERAERHLVGAGPANAATADSPTSPGERQSRR